MEGENDFYTFWQNYKYTYSTTVLVNTPFRSDIVFRNENILNELPFYTRFSEKEGLLCNLESQLTYILHGIFDTCLQF